MAGRNRQAQEQGAEDKGLLMIKISLAAAGILLAVTAADAGERTEWDMTCRGPFDIHRGLGGYDLDMRTIGTPETKLCYLRGNPEASAIVDAACQTEKSCVVRARVTFRDTPNGMPQTYNVVKVYSARALDWRDK
jgi:hypothetical protein